MNAFMKSRTLTCSPGPQMNQEHENCHVTFPVIAV
jgi:hypothetical protein